MKVDVVQVYVTTVLFLASEYYGSTLTNKVFYTVCDLIKTPFIETDLPVRYPAEEHGYENDSDSELNSEVAHWVRESQEPLLPLFPLFPFVSINFMFQAVLFSIDSLLTLFYAFVNNNSFQFMRCRQKTLASSTLIYSTAFY